MARKNTKNSSLRLNETNNESVTYCDWIPTYSLDSSEHLHSTMPPEKLVEVQMLFRSDVVAVIPDPPVEADWFRENWVCFYYYPFGIGMTFPFSKLVMDVLKSLNVTPGQLMPFAWRTLACLDAIEEKHNLQIDVDVIKCCYTLKKFHGCRYGFVNKKKDDPLILNNDTVNDRGWKHDFFFTERDSLGLKTVRIPDQWNTDGNDSVFYICYR